MIRATPPLLVRAKKQFRMWMPQFTFTLVGAKNATPDHPTYATFRVDPKMTKHEIREYLTKIYNYPVSKVHTMNYEGRRKKAVTRQGKYTYFKYKDFKKAVVYMEDGFDIGIGTRIPELEASNGTQAAYNNQSGASSPPPSGQPAIEG